MSVPQSHTLCKDERLHGKRAIDELFGSGNRLFVYPYKALWVEVATTAVFPCSFAVSIPKRRFKHAVDRNLLKRRTREAFRVNKHILNDMKQGQQIRLMLVYVSDRLLPFGEMESSIQQILQHLAQQYAPPT
ncbi:MAG: ribonuclease P protein component [Bacteroidales bacterium]|jgi:ribonuclease P protein component|nr:ribonuclease P protein component [Bacteroidales bacterium]